MRGTYKLHLNIGMDNKNKRELDKLRRTLEMADGLDVVFKKHMKNTYGKYIVFCANKKSMDELMTHIDEWFGAIDKDMHIYTVYSDEPTAIRDFIRYKDDNSKRL